MKNQFDTRQYLSRIDFGPAGEKSATQLAKLHRNHILSVPFENLDVQRGVPIRLELPHLFEKVIVKRRGGFCYELNYLFHALLTHLGYTVDMISARVYNDRELGPDFDHMALVVMLEKQRFLLDVGFGDSFYTPLKIDSNAIQEDEAGQFKIEHLEGTDYSLCMSKAQGDFTAKYRFDTTPRQIDAFLPQCHWKQHSPDSHFVKRKIVTLATPNGRMTISDDLYKERHGNQKKEVIIESSAREAQLLKEAFGLEWT